MNDTAKKFLKQLLEGYEQNIPNIEQFISDTENKLFEMKANLDRMLTEKEELEELLKE